MPYATYRNLIHTQREARAVINFSKAVANLNRAAVDVIIQEIRPYLEASCGQSEH